MVAELIAILDETKSGDTFMAALLALGQFDDKTPLPAVVRNAERTIEFTLDGREHAKRIVGRHRMIERFLTDVVGVPWDEVHEEA